MVHKLYLKAILVLVITFSYVNAQGLSREVRNLILKTVVQVIPWDDGAQDLATWSGSGTIISSEGHILTNYHVTGDLESRQNFEWHAILMVQPNAVDQPPEIAYWARYVNGDPTHDLAILKIEQLPDESPVPAGTVFPALPVGDSNTLFPGDVITIIGYPGISGSTITFTGGLMSGWVGENFQSGGKQWIKTDAKISRGNSGGAAVNNRGELIGIPTVGIHDFEDEFYEEQLFIRPISLAWAVIGPNVPSVQRADNVNSPDSSVEQEDSQASSQTTEGLPSGNYGSIALNSEVSNTIAARTEESFSYHTYVLSVPANLPQLTIDLTAGGHDIDLAVKVGSEITSYSDEGGDFDFKDFTEEVNPSHTINSPQVGDLYIDVINLVDVAADYTLAVNTTSEVVGGTNEPQNPLDPSISEPLNPLDPPSTSEPLNPLDPSSAAPQNPANTLPPITANSVSSGTIGNIAIGQSATGKLASLGGKEISYHTYILDVPTGTEQVIVQLTSDQDLDLAAKHAEEITNYSDQIDGGDWNYRDVSSNLETEMRILSPETGQWYIDVYNALKDEVVGEYTLSISQ